jgi:hypothetical protein
MNPSIFYAHIFKKDVHLRYGAGLYYTDKGKPTYNNAGDLLAIFITQELFEASESEDWSDMLGFQGFALPLLARAAEEIKGAISGVSELLADVLDHNNSLGLAQVCEALDRYYPDGFTGNYHDEDGNPINMTQSGDTLAKWLVSQAAEAFGAMPPALTRGEVIIALTNLISMYAIGLNRIYVICDQIVTL